MVSPVSTRYARFLQYRSTVALIGMIQMRHALKASVPRIPAARQKLDFERLQTETWLTNVQDKWETRSHNRGVVAAVDGVSMVDERPRLPSPPPDGADGGNAGREGNP